MASKRKTADEFLTELEKDPVYLAEQAEREAHFRHLAAQDAEAEAPILQALKEVGAEVKSVWYLAERTKPYPELIPILLEHLKKPYPPRILEGIASSLAVPEARVGWRLLVDIFKATTSTPISGPKWFVGLAICEAADLSTLDELISLIRDPRHGNDRLALLPALFRIDDPRSRAMLQELETDPVFGRELKRCRRLKQKRKKKLSEE